MYAGGHALDERLGDVKDVALGGMQQLRISGCRLVQARQQGAGEAAVEAVGEQASLEVDEKDIFTHQALQLSAHLQMVAIDGVARHALGDGMHQRGAPLARALAGVALHRVAQQQVGGEAEQQGQAGHQPDDLARQLHCPASGSRPRRRIQRRSSA